MKNVKVVSLIFIKQSHRTCSNLDTAIKCSYELSKRNYKLVVPQYRPQEDKIQYLMPIYLGATFNKLPDFALVLDHDSGYYKPETILELDLDIKTHD
ncbi:MAG: DUF3825 domain-containing protein [Saprospiraceae bacterium]|nr:DUF3825 domain-containing protein [Saprospiraceae bacterium]